MADKVIDVELELVRGVVSMSRTKEFYGHIIQQMEKVFVEPHHPIETAAVGKMPGESFIKFYINKSFLRDKVFGDKSKDDAGKFLLAVIEHEILHVVLSHLSMRFDDRVRGAVAVDLAVNSYLRKEDFGGFGCWTDTYNLPAEKGAMWYYTHLAQNAEFKKQAAEGAFGIGGLLESIVNGHILWGEVAKDPIAEGCLKDIIRKAAELCNKDFGNIPGSIVSQIEKLLEQKASIIPWGKVLRQFCASAAESNLDYTIKRESRRFGSRPGTRKEDVLNLAVIVDTSGSISDEQIVLFFSEIRWIWKNGAKVTIVEADADVCRPPYPYKGKFDGKVAGRGGTDLEPALKLVERKYDAAIYFTDFYAPKVSRRYRIPTLWVLTSDMTKEQYPYPWGRHIKIEDGVAVAG